jgi:hypothetical protein
MPPLLKSLIVGSTLVTLAAAPAMAAGKPKPVPHDPQTPAPVTGALGGVSAPNVRLAALIGGPFAPQPSLVYRSKGVASVTHPSTGLWCVKPSFSVSLTSIIPVLTVDFSNSSGAFGEMAQYRPGTATSGCPTGTIPILTFEQDTDSSSSTFNQFIFSDNVAFTIIVP